MYYDLTKGKISRCLVLFALPMIAGNLMQQFYNIADTLIVGRVIGKNALAAVGSAYTLMTFLTSVFLGLSMGAGALFSIYKGKEEKENLKAAVGHAFVLIMAVTIVVNIAVYVFMDSILLFLRVPKEVLEDMKAYLLVVYAGLIATSLFNFFACLLRALGNSTVPLVFLVVSSVLNIGLDLLFVIVFSWGIRGAAAATVIAQCVSGVGILMVQGLVNSFGATVMAAFAAAVKIDTFAYLPVQDFGNAYSTFAAQNYGAGNKKRIRQGTREAFGISIIFSIVISVLVCLLAAPLMGIFVSAKETAVIACGMRYLRIEGAFYLGIGCLFLLYGYYRAIDQAQMSLILTIISLGTRVVLAYILSAYIGETGIWMSIPIGWGLADVIGIWYMKKAACQKKNG